jgi:hypothetical protein
MTKAEEAKAECKQSTMLICADVIKMEEKVVKSKKKSSIMPESVIQPMEASVDKDADEIFVHNSVEDKAEPEDKL